MTVSAIGSASVASGTGTATLFVTSTGANIGDAVLVSTHIASATVHIASLSIGGVASWTHIGGAVSGTHSVDLWLGVITSLTAFQSTGSITFTGSAAITATVNAYAAQILTGGCQGTTWSVDGSLATSNNTVASTTITYPTLTPAGAGEVYFGYGIAVGTPALTTGATAGYTVAVDGANNAVMYDPNVSAAQSPITKQTSSSTSFALGALIISTPAPAGSIQQIGVSVTSNGTAVTTVAVTPRAIGNLLVVVGDVHSTTIHFTTLSGGGVTTWTPLVGPFVGTSGTYSLNMWMGVVTATGSSTVTAATSASISGLVSALVVQEFTLNNTAATWSLDTTGTLSNATSTTMAYPSMTPAVSGELYFGLCNATGSITDNTMPANYTEIFSWNFASQAAIYNPQLGTGAQSPTMTHASGLSWTVGALIKGLLPASGSRIRMISQAVNRASSY